MAEDNYLHDGTVIIAGAVVTYLIGFFWYTDVLFGSVWVRAANIDIKKIPSDITNSFILELLGRFFKSLIFNLFFKSLDYKTINSALLLALYFFIGFNIPATLSKIAWEQKTQDYLIIQLSEQLICLLVLSCLNTYL